jgi:hypothetical protein
MKTEAIERLINAVDVWVATGVFENTVFSPITDDAKEELKNINVIVSVGTLPKKESKCCGRCIDGLDTCIYDIEQD